MASSSPRGALPSLVGQRSDSDSREPLHKLPALQRSVPSRPPIIDPQAVLKRHVKQKEPSLPHLKVREQMNRFPGWYTEPAPSKPTDQEQRRHEPVHMPPLPSTKNASDQQGSKNVASTPPPPRPRFSIKSFPQLGPAPQIELRKYSSTEYIFIHNKAVFSVCEDDIKFQSLECWQNYNEIHSKLRRIPFFARYKMWKPFYVWRTKIRAKKICLAKQSLQKYLFILSPSLSSALMDIRKMCCQITETGFCHMKKQHTYTLQEFQDTKIKQLQEASKDLEKFHELVKEVTVCACGHYRLETEACPDGEKKIVSEINMFFFSSRIIHLIRLIDCLVATTLHSSVVNTVAEMLTLLQVQAGQTPSDAIIQSWSHDSTAAEKEMKKFADSEALHFHPVFMSELMLDTNSLTYKPSEENFQDAVADFIERFKNMVMSVKALSTDPVFDSVIRPEGDKVVKKDENAHPLEDILKNDGHLKSITNSIQELLWFAFAAAEVYSNTFERFQLVYRENESLDLDALHKQDHDVAFFEKALTLYPSQHEEATRIQQERRLGLLLVDTRQLKEKLQSSSLRCLNVINHMLTQLAKRKVDTIMAEVSEAEVKLGLHRSTTAELADFLTFLDEIENSIGELKKEQETVSKMYNLINVHAVPTPLEDVVRFATLETFIDSLERITADAVEEKDSTMQRFCSSLQMDIKELNNEDMKIRLKLLDPQILDIDANSSHVRQQLREIQVSIEDLKSKASCCVSYQRNFKMEVTTFESLEQLMSMFKLTQLLWDSLEQWDCLQSGWQQSTLEQLDMEQFTSQVNKYSKCISQLEEGLPPNSSVPCLKEKVEVMMHRLPVITDLHNPHMKPKHWKTLKSLVGTSLNVNELTIAALEELNIFQYAKEIHEVSEQAPGEVSVETIISKVEDLWKNTEFTVLPHGDSKDAFILGGTEDIQALLDDSIINVGTVASSCYVAPIKWRVNELLRQLTLFNQTLDEWLTCQRNWLSLESMFMAPDIQRQLPTESDMFLKVDNSWKKLMAKVKRMPNAFDAATQSGLLETLQENNTLLNEIQKCLEAYLESKRVMDQ
ncbi:dynein heavy chain 6, axonemal-like isoform X2 [Archocentrus centrarchus]|uniref:dynein heavy chain 6, axonemal-like isoform X2 n=1 Tax=Archocentrus centrarchus TaxID=63155 RepID=UPI0011E9FD12|nr:dynein heavy chain 6, axonemal-like isoform X2 [Archocentrus centrarchus]